MLQCRRQPGQDRGYHKQFVTKSRQTVVVDLQLRDPRRESLLGQADVRPAAVTAIKGLVQQSAIRRHSVVDYSTFRIERGIPRDNSVNCLSEDDVVRFVTGGLSQAAIPPIDLHIDACRSCRLLVSVFASQTGDRPRSHESLCAFAVGDELAGRYTVKSLLGVGGMGEVYEVHDAVLGETVALKTIAVGSSLNADGVTRFKAEAQMARRVTHPNVCRVFDVGFHSSGRHGAARDQSPGIPFLTMELDRKS